MNTIIGGVINMYNKKNGVCGKENDYIVINVTNSLKYIVLCCTILRNEQYGRKYSTNV